MAGNVLCGRAVHLRFNGQDHVDSIYAVAAIPPPWIPEFLFSSQNGWFFWTPLALLGVAGLVFGLVKVGRVFLPWLVVIALEVTLVSSVRTEWHGADAFGARYMTSSAPLVALGLITLLFAASRVMRAITISVAVACCLFTSLFALQFRLYYAIAGR